MKPTTWWTRSRVLTTCTMLVLLLACSPRNAPAPAPQPAPSVSGPVDAPSQGFEADLARTQAFLATRPREERPLHVSGFEQVPGLPNLSAQTCGACHPAILAQWETSIHRHAWVDPQYQAEIGKSGNRWLCLNCHTPLLSQQDRWAVSLVDDDVERPELVPNPRFDAALRDEGITCASCHVRDGKIRGPGLGGQPPHPVEVDPTLRSGELCMQCHQAERVYEGKSFVCTFDTGDEWREGPYDDEGQTCVSCHMPRATMPAAVGQPERQVAQHWWKGAGIPKVPGVSPPDEANVPGLGLEAQRDGDALVVRMANANAGHMLPTGDPERWVQVDVRFLGPDGPVGEPWQQRFGQTWEWTTPPRKVADNRLKPRETRTERVPVPEGAVRAEVVGSAHRISEENAAYHHLGDYPRSVETHRLDVEL